ncbi:hypothetical protein [Kitasatospora sp. NPDC101183]|uniref:hypothetical protein n=1 Tax=Kitasatospora sp. NPDC101183 TaxID=3364100 RepID=UPI0037FE89C3
MNRTVIVATTRARLSHWVTRAALLFAVAGATAVALPAGGADAHHAAAPAAVTGAALMADDPWV